MSGAEALYQYGAIGIVLIAAGYAVKILFADKAKAHDLERQRADRMEAEVRRLNELMQDKIVPILADATKIISEALRDTQKRKDD